MINHQKKTATLKDVLDASSVAKMATCEAEVKSAAQALGRGQAVGIVTAAGKKRFVAWSPACDWADDAGINTGEDVDLQLPWENGDTSRANSYGGKGSPLASRYYALAIAAISEIQATTGSGRLPFAYVDETGERVSPAKAGKLDKRAYQRLRAALVKEADRLEKLAIKQQKIVNKYPSPKSRYGNAARRDMMHFVEATEKLDKEIEELDALYELAADCRGEQCVDDVARLDKKLAKAPKSVPAKKYAKAPSDHDQKLIAQAHLFELIKKNDPSIKLPEIAKPATDWVPNGPRQISRYSKIWNGVFDDVFFPAAQEAIKKNNKDAEKIARALDVSLFGRYESGVSLDRIFADFKTKKDSRPADPKFFPKRTENGKRKTRRNAKPNGLLAKRVLNPSETLYHGASKDKLSLHPGICLTDSRKIARQYGRNVFEIEVKAGTTYNAERVDGYDRNSDLSPGDKGSDFEGWIEFEDESPGGKQHRTWRAMDSSALNDILSVTLLEDD